MKEDSKMSMSLKNYGRPRPVYLKVIGDTCLYASTAVTGISIYMDEDLTAYIALGAGIVGYFFTNLFNAIREEQDRIQL